MNQLERDVHFLKRYAIVTTTLLAVLSVAAFTGSSRHEKFDEIDVGRINIVEPNGMYRMVISNRPRSIGPIYKGKPFGYEGGGRPGIIFFNDEGTENGGLVQNGQLDKSGKVQAGLSLTFDRFRQDQMVQLLVDENGDEARAGIIINDRPSYKTFSIDEMFQLADQAPRLAPAERDALFQRHQALGHFGNRRGYFGTKTGSAQLVLNDPQGRPRLRLDVSDRGEPSIDLLDEAGHTVRSLR